MSRVGLNESQSSEAGGKARQDDYRQGQEVRSEGSRSGVNGSIIIYETGQRRQTRSGRIHVASRTSHVSHELPPPPLSRARFSPTLSH